MNYNYFKILLIIFSLLLINNVFAETIDEKTFYELDLDNVVILKGEDKCIDININNLNHSLNSTLVLQLEIENYIPVNSGVEFNFNLNGVNENTIKDNEIKKKNVIKLFNYKKNQNNTLEICINNSFLPKIIISKKSKIGNYLLAEILESNFIQKIPSKIETYSLVPVEVSVKNTGYAPIYINLNNAKERYLENTNLENISGTTTYNGLIDAQSGYSITYYIKTGQDTKFISPRAYLTYTDEFGREFELKTDLKIINTSEKLIALESYIDLPREITTNEVYEGQLILRNISNDLIENIYIAPNYDYEIELLNTNELEIKKNDIIEVPFKIKSFDNKTQKLNFEIKYTRNNINNTLGSEVINIISKPKTNYTSEIIGALILIFLISYIWILKK